MSIDVKPENVHYYFTIGEVGSASNLRLKKQKQPSMIRVVKQFLSDGQNSPPQRKQGNRVTRVHPGRSIWNLRVHPWKRKIIFQIITFRFYVGWSSGAYWAVHLLMGFPILAIFRQRFGASKTSQGKQRINPIILTTMEAEVTGVHGLTCEACSQLIRIPVNLAPQKGNKMISPGNLKKLDPRTPCPLGPIPFPYFRGFLWEWYWE